MEMVKYLAFALVLVGSLSLAALAEAGHRHRGCASCGGCYGGYCGVPVAPAPIPAPAPVAPPPMAAAPQAVPAAVVAIPATQPAPVYYTSGRRLFGWRR